MNIFLEFESEFDFFLPKDKTGRFEYALNRNATVKDIIESLGVPHTEVGGMKFDGQDIDFSYIPVSQGLLQVLAIHPPFKVLSPSRLRPCPLDSIRFLADVNVIRLGRLLILSGFDVKYSPAYSDDDLADMAATRGRIILTRDTALLKRKKIVFAKRIIANLPYDQLVETIRFFGLEQLVSFFTRCTACNVALVSRSKKEVFHLLEPKTKLYFNSFLQCPRCKKVFWKGSHYDTIQRKILSLGISIPDDPR